MRERQTSDKANQKWRDSDSHCIYTNGWPSPFLLLPFFLPHHHQFLKPLLYHLLLELQTCHWRSLWCAKHFISMSNQNLREAEQIKCIQRDVGEIKWFLNYFRTALLGMQPLRCVALWLKYSGWSKRGGVEQNCTDNHFFFSGVKSRAILNCNVWLLILSLSPMAPAELIF